jgi:hypothetical protein
VQANRLATCNTNLRDDPRLDFSITPIPVLCHCVSLHQSIHPTPLRKCVQVGKTAWTLAKTHIVCVQLFCRIRTGGLHSVQEKWCGFSLLVRTLVIVFPNPCGDPRFGGAVFGHLQFVPQALIRSVSGIHRASGPTVRGVP